MLVSTYSFSTASLILLSLSFPLSRLTDRSCVHSLITYLPFRFIYLFFPPSTFPFSVGSDFPVCQPLHLLLVSVHSSIFLHFLIFVIPYLFPLLFCIHTLVCQSLQTLLASIHSHFPHFLIVIHRQFPTQPLISRLSLSQAISLNPFSSI